MQLSDKTPLNRRADFPEPIRRILAQRVAYRCSNPVCRALTIGPGPGTADVVPTGTAAHIFAAAPNGPRGAGDHGFEERRQIENGIWLCAKCARLIDAGAGSAHPPALLRSWKDLNEALTRIEQGGYSTPIGWVSSIDFLRDPLIQTPVEIRLGRKNVICGNNGSGKSTLLNLLQSLTETDHVTRRASYGEEVSVQIHWFDPHPRTALIQTSDGHLTNEVDGKRVPFVPRPYRVIAYRENRHHPYTSELESLSNSFRLSKWVLREILEDVPRVEGITLSEVVVRDGEVFGRMPSEKLLSIKYWSAAQRIELFFGAAILLASLQAEVEPTVLVFDGPFSLLVPELPEGVSRLFDSVRQTFQVIFSSPYAPTGLGSDWLVTTCVRDAGRTSIVQTAGSDGS